MAVVNAALADVPLAELLPRLAELGIPAGEVRTLDRVYEWEQTRSQGLVIDVDDPLLRSIEIPGPPIRLLARQRFRRRTRDPNAPAAAGGLT